MPRAREGLGYFEEDGKWFTKETNTMPQWAGSCWYYFRFTDTKNGEVAFSLKVDEDWIPVDLYLGGWSMRCCICCTRGSGTMCCTI